MQRWYSFMYVGGNVSTSESMQSVCQIDKNAHFDSGSIAFGIPFVLSFPNQHRCQIGECCAMPCTPLYPWNLIVPGDIQYKIFAVRQRYPLVWAGTYTCLVCTYNFFSLALLSFFSLRHRLCGRGLGASRPQDFYTDLGCCRVNLQLFWALEAHVWNHCMYRHLKIQNRPFIISDSFLLPHQ